MMYGSHESTQSLEIEREIEFDILVDCTARGCRAQISGPPEGCYPSEAPEFELDTIHVLDEKGNLLKISWDVFVAFVGDEVAEKMVDKAINDAAESGDF